MNYICNRWITSLDLQSFIFTKQKYEEVCKLDSVLGANPFRKLCSLKVSWERTTFSTEIRDSNKSEAIKAGMQDYFTLQLICNWQFYNISTPPPSPTHQPLKMDSSKMSPVSINTHKYCIQTGQSLLLLFVTLVCFIDIHVLIKFKQNRLCRLWEVSTLTTAPSISLLFQMNNFRIEKKMREIYCLDIYLIISHSKFDNILWLARLEQTIMKQREYSQTVIDSR